ncbi:hypothetical protein [Streptomyces sp. DT203]|uniref:hypothetical protein n=1 Tax=Streptomyces sp. DT203 TaxID=3393424 RepID=UPI003CEEB61F
MAARRSIEFGDSITGMLVDGIGDTPYVAATLHLEEATGVQIEVPYIDIPGTSQFDGTAQWFNAEKPPSNLLLTSLDGDISLFECDYSGHTRRHDVRDPQFSGKTLSGRVVENPFYQLISRSTVKEHANPAPSKGRLNRPLAEFSNVDSKGLEEWSREYDKWDRFIHPAVSALSRPGAILENLVVNAAMSMEAAGSLLGQVSGEAATCRANGKPTTATYMYRCLVRSGWDWSGICKSTAGLARAIGNNYNTIKHFDRGQFPDPTETYLVSNTSALIVRMLAIKLARPDQSTAGLFVKYVTDFEHLKEEFRFNGLIVDDAGNFATR